MPSGRYGKWWLFALGPIWLAAGCGGMDLDRQGQTRLKVLDLSPRDGEVGVARDPDVVAVFSDAMELGEGEGKLNERTFWVADAQGSRRSDLVQLSALDDLDATAVLRLAGLTPGAEYTVVIAETLAGKGTAALGIELRARFRVAD